MQSLLPVLLSVLAPFQADKEFIVPGDLTGYDHFGSAMDCDGDTLVVGAPKESPGPYGPGAVYVFERSGGAWVETAQLSGVSSDQAFGTSVAIDGDILAVGAPYDAEAGLLAGAVFVYERSPAGWARTAKLLPLGGASVRFGMSVAVSGGWLIAGAPLDERAGPLAGAAQVYRRQGAGWTLAADLLPPEPAVWGNFGSAVALERGLAVVGQPGGLSTHGSAYVFDEPFGGGYTRLSSGDPEPAGFGHAVDTDGVRIAVGAPGEDGAGALYDAGHVYLYERGTTGWAEAALVSDPREDKNGLFGWSVAVQGERLLGGAWQKDLGTGGVGAALLFELEGGAWAFRDALTTGQPGLSYTGVSVALSRDWAAAGAPFSARPAPFYGGVVLLLALP